MFDIGWSELLILAVVAILIVGPRDLPRMMGAVGKYAGKLRRTANEFKAQFDDAIRESELDDLRKELEEVREANPINDIKKSVTDINFGKLDSDTGAKANTAKPANEVAGMPPDAGEVSSPPPIEPPVAHGESSDATSAESVPNEPSVKAASGKPGA